MKRCIFILMALLLMSAVSAVQYDVVVVDKGESLVVATIEDSGLHTLPLPEDVIDVHVEGGLYLVKDNEIQVSIGSTKKAIVAYKTDFLTTKVQDKWNFDMQIPESADITVNVPKNTIIHETNPEALVENAQYKTIAWEQNNKIRIIYSFQEEGILPITGNVVQEQSAGGTQKVVWAVVLVLGVIILFISGRYATKFVKKQPASESEAMRTVPKQSEKETVMKTLSENEMNVVSLLMKEQGQMKRNNMEKESGLAKSSLASTLYGLERKNIIHVDKTYGVHVIKFTEWFKEL